MTAGMPSGRLALVLAVIVPSLFAPTAVADWKPRHPDVKPIDLVTMKVRTYEIGFSKIRSRAKISVPVIYVLGEVGRYDVVLPTPEDACAKDKTLCGLQLHAESGRLPAFGLRVGFFVKHEEATCTSDRCTTIRKKVGKYATSWDVNHQIKRGERDALVCWASFEAVNERFTPALEKWLVKVCTDVAVSDLPQK